MRTPLVAFLIAVAFAIACIVFAVASGQDTSGWDGNSPSALRHP